MFQTQFTPPNQTIGFPNQPGQTVGFYGARGSADPFILTELARRRQEAVKAANITFWFGLLCMPILLVITYLEWDKSRKLQEDVARMGVDVEWWLATYGGRGTGCPFN